jgi:hypothetical protein
VFWYATQNELIGQYVDHVGGLELPVAPDGQTFVGELVDEVEHALAAVSDWCRQNRHRSLRDQHAHLSQMLRGHY